MSFNKNRNSRDDKSGRDSNKPSRSSSSNRRPQSGENSSDRKDKPYGDRKESSSGERKSFGDRKPYGDRKEGGFGGERKSYGDRKEGGFSGERKSYGDRKPFGDRKEGGFSGERKSYGDRKEGGFGGERKSYGDRKPFGDRKEGGFSGERKSYGDRKEGGFGGERKSYGDRKPFGDRKEGGFSGERKSYGDRKPFGDRKEGGFGGERKSFGDRKPFGDRKEGGFGGERKSYGDRKPFGDRKEGGFSGEKRERLNNSEQPRNYRKREPQGEFSEVKDEQVRLRSRQAKGNTKKEDDTIRLNRYIANSGICSRRKADELIAAGVVSVNGVVVSELGAKVNPAVDQIRYNGELLKREKMVYVLLNKPKDFITTTDDPQERKTVMELVDKASKERIYPVGRLDRNTTGLLLMTNDGDLAEKLSHPRNNIVKIYNVELERNLYQGDFNKIAFGLELEDGFIKPDAVSYVTGGAKNEIGIQIHSGKNRIVRRIFESLGYEVVKLDRVIYAGLSKKDLPRGKWRYLSEQEIINLKHLIK
ncbi:ribosomal large subunit pseudouridine synthase B [Pedobacter glucosidilyticus]|nr:pseudouridine synthase [Pedobacter glucosidilyticus]KHJ37797.1 ribosomal large subunit pseudouridine synthase B [Pedobacter glucosidilyticus]